MRGNAAWRGAARTGRQLQAQALTRLLRLALWQVATLKDCAGNLRGNAAERGSAHETAAGLEHRHRHALVGPQLQARRLHDEAQLLGLPLNLGARVLLF